jgi:alanyl-tRNA synthetase
LNNNNRLAHTAEHAFIGSLQKLLGQTLKVRKVEHKDAGASNTAFIQIPQLDLDTVIKAEVEVNSLIALGRSVTTRKFSSLEEAKREIPNLRANEERIIAAMPTEVKVVEIENHDLSACTMEHAHNLQECDFFLVTRLSKSGDEYQVDFIVGRHAKDTAAALTSKLLRVCNTLGANINTIENTAQKLRSEYEINVRKLKALSLEKLSAIQPVTNGSIILLKSVFENLSDDQL